MIAVIFEFTPAEGRFPEYMNLVDTLRADLAQADGFVSLERFESITNPGKFVSLQFWRDEEAVSKWRNRSSTARRRRRDAPGFSLRIAYASPR